MYQFFDLRLIYREQKWILYTLYFKKLFTFVGIVKFFGKLCLHNGPEKVLEMYPDYVNILFGMLSEGDLNIQSLAIETIGVIGHSAEGKKLLALQGTNDCILTGKQTAWISYCKKFIAGF